MLLGTILGFALFGSSLVAATVFLGVPPGPLLDPLIPALLIATTGAMVSIEYRPKDFFLVLQLLFNPAKRPPPNVPKLNKEIMRLTTLARREGLFRLDREIAIQSNTFLKKALRLAADGISAEALVQALSIELEKHEAEAERGVSLLVNAARSAWQAGSVLATLQFLKTIAPLPLSDSFGVDISQAVALLFGGMVLSWGLLQPVASRLRTELKISHLLYQAAIVGFASLVEGEGPRTIKEKIGGFHRP